MARLLRRVLATLGLALLPVALGATEAMPPADTVLAAAQAEAAAEQKAVFVHFSASWCSWCRRLEGFLHDEQIEPVFRKYFVPVRLVVREREPNQDRNHPGGMDVLTRLGGAERGIPFTAVLAADGALLANSLMPVDDPDARDGVENLGYPGSRESITAFLDMLQVGAPAISDAERKLFNDWFVAHMPQ